MEKKHKILEISPFTLSLPLDGGKECIVERIKYFANNKNIDIRLITLNTNNIGNMKENLFNLSDIKTIPINKSKSKITSVLKWMLLNKPKTIIDFNAVGYREKITNYILNEKFEVVVFEFPYTTEFVDLKKLKTNDIRIVIVAHGVEEEFFRELRSLDLPQFIIDVETKRWNKYEKKILNLADTVIGIAPNDVSFLRENHELNNIYYLPPYLKKENKFWVDNEDSNYIIFCGSLSFLPNYHGIKWFLDKVCQGDLTCLGNGKVKLKITGKISEKIKDKFSKYKNIDFTGYLSDEDLEKLMLNAKCSIVPILIGSGIKIKLLKSLSYGIPTITTMHGASGIIYDGQEPFYIGKNESMFLSLTNLLINNRDKRKILSKRAKQFFESVYASEKNIKNWENLILDGRYE